jgi:Reverse transcriptase (RNA-dependent DNA polymerase)
VTCPSWLSNTVLIKKSNDGWRMCIDFIDLNKTYPMDPFPLPKIDQLIDSTSGFTFFSFMDVFSRYNQIQMHPTDEEKTTFIIDQGLFCYKVMPFSFNIRNISATYQRMVNIVFEKQIGRNIEAYVDVMLVKSMTDQGLINALNETFKTMRKVGMKLNPKKSFFGLTSEKFLGFVVSMRGIKIYPSKSKAILEMIPPKNLKELQSLTG